MPARVTTTSAAVLDSGLIEITPTVSGHSTTYILIDLSYKHERSFNRKVLIYKRGDYDRLNYLISNTSWNFISEGNVGFACEQFTSKFM